MDRLPQLTPYTPRQLVLLTRRERIASRTYKYPKDFAAVEAIDQELVEIEKVKTQARKAKSAALPDAYFLGHRWGFETDYEFYEFVRGIKPLSLLLPENQEAAA